MRAKISKILKGHKKAGFCPVWIKIEFGEGGKLALPSICFNLALNLLFYCLSKRIAKEEQKDSKRKAKEIYYED
jgi:predicted Na+-dependent transporter